MSTRWQIVISVVVLGALWLLRNHWELLIPGVSRLTATRLRLLAPEHNRYDGERIEFVVDARPLLKSINQIPFNWSHWIDLEKTWLHEHKQLNEDYPLLRALRLNDRESSLYLSWSTWQERSMVAQIYCKYELTIPFRVVHIQEGSIKQYKPWHNDQMMLHRQAGHTSANKYFEAAVFPVLPVKNESDYLFPEICEGDYAFRARDMINSESVAPDHRVTLREGLRQAPIATKYFREVRLRNDNLRVGIHYDWRFFRRVLSPEQKRHALHRLARHWQEFADAAGIRYWYAHGSLLGCKWNGMALPWDSDHDIQVPVLELDRLARDFNRTLVVVGEEGFGKYLLDMNPNYVHRTKGNGMNVIDGRFVDVQTGLYIDITGLAQTKPGLDEVSCKNMHRYNLTYYTRLRRTHFEGSPALIPMRADEALEQEYSNYKSPTFKGWDFDFKTRQWRRPTTHRENAVYRKLYANLAADNYKIEKASRKDDAHLFELVRARVDTKILTEPPAERIATPEIY